MLLGAVAGLTVTSVYLGQIQVPSLSELEVLYILAVLLVTIKGLENGGIFRRISRDLQDGRLLALKLVMATFFLSMIVTNDVAIMIAVPLTLAIGTDRKDSIVILETLAANAGSALTPFGNPQNLFIYWFYRISPKDFLITIAPFTLVFFVVLAAASLMLGTAKNPAAVTATSGKPARRAYFYVLSLVAIVLGVLHLAPVTVGLVAVVYALVWDRRSLRIDYSLLVTFFCFFGLADNLRVMVGSTLERSGHVFLLSALSSQIISNVPATLLFAKFTSQWKALLWGVSVGGFGSLVGSLANLIAYRLYVTGIPGARRHFTLKFHVASYTAFLVGVGLYFFLAT